MARGLNDSNQGSARTARTARFDDAVARIAVFGAWASGLDVTHVDNDELHQLVAKLGALDAQVDVLRANVLTEIDRRGGDPIDSQKRNAKTSHSKAKQNTKTSKGLDSLPNTKKKMAAGKGMSAGKAGLLADAAKKTSASDIDSAADLLSKVEKQDEDAAKQTIDKWVRKHQSNADRLSLRQKRIDERQFWMFVKDGMVHTHGKLPANVANMTLYRRWEAEKSRLWRLDGGRERADQSVRTDDQRGADAYANVIENIDGQRGGLRDRADWSVIKAEPAEAESAPASPHVPESPARPSPPPMPARAQVIITAKAEQLAADDPDMLADIIGGGPLLRSELERHMCTADIYGVLFDPTQTETLWAGRRVRTCTDAQWRALLVRDGECVLTGAPATHCEAHHILPFSAPAKGRSDITNLVMVSATIHQWLHANDLTIYRKPDGTWNTRPATAEEIAPRKRKSRPTAQKAGKPRSTTRSNILN